jgi:sulfur carrier protein ThiS adenylyltransferase
MRQGDIVPADRIAKQSATVIGVGAIGRNVAINLAAIGVPRLQLIDFDHVEDVNLATQGFLEEDLGEAKVEAVGRHCRRINSEIEITEINQRYGRKLDVGNVIFACVDDMDVRKFIFEQNRHTTDFFIDGRMSAESLRVLTAVDETSKEYYKTTLFSNAEAYQDSCTAKSTIQCATIAAGMIVEQFTKYLRSLPIESDIQMNIMSAEMSVEGPEVMLSV